VFASLKLAELVKLIARHDPGRGVTEIPKPPAMNKITLSSEEELLIRRAFSDFKEFGLEERTQGRSGARVLFVHHLVSLGGSVRPLPYIVKIEPITDSRTEKERYNEVVASSIPFQNRPALDLARYVEGSTRGALVQDFVDRVLPLWDVLESGNASVVVSALFEGALRGCRVRREVPPSTSRPLEEMVIGPERWGLSSLNEACDLATRLFGLTATPGDLRQALSTLPSGEPWCFVHGDLHDKNIYVSAAAANVILIDFREAGVGRAAMDPACLEVSLAFAYGDIIGWSLADSGPFLQSAYKYPLTPVIDTTSPSGRGWLNDAIRTIRMHALADGLAPYFYAAAVACYLVRFASYPSTGPRANGPPERRALAYHLADRLVAEAAKAAREALGP